MTPLEPAAAECLERTRSAVLNVLVVIGLLIAVSGFTLRRRDRGPDVRVTEAARRGILGGLFGVVVASYAARRVLGSRAALRDPDTRGARFLRAHVTPALIAVLALPLGLVYAWVTRPLLNEVAPFWIAALGLGFFALPRAAELADFDVPMPSRTEA